MCVDRLIQCFKAWKFDGFIVAFEADFTGIGHTIVDQNAVF